MAITGIRLKLEISVNSNITNNGSGLNTYITLHMNATIATGAGMNGRIACVAKPSAPDIKMEGKMLPP